VAVSENDDICVGERAITSSFSPLLCACLVHDSPPEASEVEARLYRKQLCDRGLVVVAVDSYKNWRALSQGVHKFGADPVAGVHD